MSDEKASRKTVTFKELLLSNIYTQEALINILVKKGILTKKEVLEEIKKIEAVNSNKENNNSGNCSDH